MWAESCFVYLVQLLQLLTPGAGKDTCDSNYSIVGIQHILFDHMSMDIWVSFYLLAVMTNASMNVGV